MPDDVGAFIKRSMRRHDVDRAARDVSTGHDFLLGHVAVEWKMVSPEALVDCLREQQDRRARGDSTELGDILLERRLLDEEGLAKVVRECVARAKRSGLSQRFDLIERVGEGAMAVVYRAMDRTMGRVVALKLLRLPLESHAGAKARFTREAHAAGSLSHPNVVRIYDAGEDDGRTYLVMEFVAGRPMSHELGRPMRDLVSMLEGAARGVQAAHDAGIIHRDLKPGNILVTKDGQAKVADFGLAYVNNSSLTQSGAQLGTPLYMAPEQVRGGDITFATDVYALGAILYEILTGRTPFIGVSIAEIYTRIQTSDAPRPGSIHDGVPADLEAVAMKALSKEPAKRYASAAAFADDLGRHLRGEAVVARPESAFARTARRVSRHKAIVIPSVLAVLLLVAISTAWLLSSHERERRASERMTQALALEARGDLRQAETAFAAVLEIAPGDSAAAAGIGRCRMRLRDAEVLVRDAAPLVDEAILNLYRETRPVAAVRDKATEACRLLQQAIQMAPGLVEAHLQLGRVLDLLGDRAGAEAALRRAEELEPASKAVQSALGRLLVEGAYMAGMANTAMSVPMSVVENRRAVTAEAVRHLERASSGDESTVESWVRRALLAYARDNYAETAAIARDGFAACADHHGVETLYWMHGVVSSGQAAIDSFSKAIQIRPRYALALYGRATARLVARVDLEAAERDYTLAMELVPGIEAAFLNRGNVRVWLSRFADAEADFDQALLLRPEQAGTLFNRALARFGLERVPEALEDLDNAIRLHPTYALAYGHRARARYQLGNSLAALDDAEHALKLNPDVAIAHVVRGSIRLDDGDDAGALRDLTRGLDLDPGNSVGRRIRARIRARQADWKGVLEDVDYAIAARADADMVFMRGYARLMTGDAAGAEEDCNTGLKLKPEKTEALGIRALAREMLGKRQEALEDARAALEAGVSEAQADVLRRLIDRLRK